MKHQLLCSTWPASVKARVLGGCLFAVRREVEHKVTEIMYFVSLPRDGDENPDMPLF